MPTLYTRRADNAGWLSVRLSRTGQLASLCEYTQVDVLREAAGRTYFKIVDGYVSVGEEASLTTPNAAKYLSDVARGAAAVIDVQYDGAPTDVVSPYKGLLKQQWAILTFGGQTAQVTLNSVWNSTYSPIAPGTHNILAPDYSHRNTSTAGYAAATPGMVGNDVWFPIGFAGSLENSSRYIHVGHLSEGCVTVYELTKWSALYAYLISHREPRTGGKLIGKLKVRR